MALDAMAPGAGEAAAIGVKIGIQEVTRAVGFGAQAAGIGVQGLMSTFLPNGGSDLANNSWLTRIAGGFIGAHPALPNTAGKNTADKALTTDQKPAAPPPMPAPGVHAGSGAPPGPQVNVTYNNVGATEDRAGADLTNHLTAMNSGPGW